MPSAGAGRWSDGPAGDLLCDRWRGGTLADIYLQFLKSLFTMKLHLKKLFTVIMTYYCQVCSNNLAKYFIMWCVFLALAQTIITILSASKSCIRRNGSMKLGVVALVGLMTLGLAGQAAAADLPPISRFRRAWLTRSTG